MCGTLARRSALITRFESYVGEVEGHEKIRYERLPQEVIDGKVEGWSCIVQMASKAA